MHDSMLCTIPTLVLLSTLCALLLIIILPLLLLYSSSHARTDTHIIIINTSENTLSARCCFVQTFGLLPVNYCILERKGKIEINTLQKDKNHFFFFKKEKKSGQLTAETELYLLQYHIKILEMSSLTFFAFQNA